MSPIATAPEKGATPRAAAETDVADYGLLSNCRTAALSSRDGSIDWLCMPRFDAPSIFARVLDPEAGHWSIRPMGEHEVERRYHERSLILDTSFETSEGEAVLRDALTTGPNEGGHDLGSAASPILVRSVECVSGHVTLDFEYAPRPEYGLVHPLLQRDEDGLLGQGGPSVLRLSIPPGMDVEVGDSSAHARIELGEGDHIAFALEHRWSWEERPCGLGQDDIDALLAETESAWKRWAEEHPMPDGPYAEATELSGRVLRGLTFHPTGAMVAAPTTSFPTQMGGSRNWDYRYTWLRDSAFTIEAFREVACGVEATELFRFLDRTALSQVRRQGTVQAVYGIGGEHDLSEREIGHLAGFRDSSPVRVGNAAWNQRQLDVYGEIIAAAYQLRDELDEHEPRVRAFLVKLADVAADQWHLKDHGIWEMRTPPAHYVHSKLMCWVALDRSIRMAEQLEASDHVDDWCRERDEVREAILDRGWSDDIGAFRQTFDRDALDASTLMIPIVGFLDASDERVVSTMEAIEDRLTDDRGLVYRYRAHDGLEGAEGTFLLCTFWLAEAWARAGRVGRATEIFERAVGYANDLGLLSEQVESKSGALLGNFPQAFSHVGLVNASSALANAEATTPTP